MAKQYLNTVLRYVGVDVRPDRSGFQRLLNGIRKSWATLWGTSPDGNKLYRIRASQHGGLHSVITDDRGYIARVDHAGQTLRVIPYSTTGYVATVDGDRRQYVRPRVGVDADDLEALDNALATVPKIADSRYAGKTLLDLSGGQTHDFGTVSDRLIAITGRAGGTEDYTKVYDSDTGGGNDRLLGILTPGMVLYGTMTGRYIDFVQPTNDGEVCILDWVNP